MGTDGDYEFDVSERRARSHFSTFFLTHGIVIEFNYLKTLCLDHHRVFDPHFDAILIIFSRISSVGNRYLKNTHWSHNIVCLFSDAVAVLINSNWFSKICLNSAKQTQPFAVVWFSVWQIEKQIIRPVAPVNKLQRTTKKGRVYWEDALRLTGRRNKQNKR